MTDRTLIRTGRTVAVAGAVLGLAGSVMLISGGHTELWWSRGAVHNAAWALFIAIAVWLVTPSQPRNRAVWILALSALSGIYVAGLAVAATLVGEDSMGLLDIRMVPADLPPAAAWALAFAVPMSILSLFTFLTLGLLLFPDGSLPSPRWRPVAWFSVVSISVMMVGQGWAHRPASFTNYSVLARVGQIGFGVAALLSLLALIHRSRQSVGPTRQQFKWIGWGAAIFVSAVVVHSILSGTRYEDAVRPVSLLAGVIFVGSYGVALGRYRLYDIDVVISKTFVYGALAVFITAVYVATVVGIGQLIGNAQEPNPLLAIGATTVVAVAFEPLRRRLQRVANRIVYGRRATPYEVLSDFSQNIVSSDEELLSQVARSLAEGTTAVSAQVWLKGDDELTCAAIWPDSDESVVGERASVVDGLVEAHLAEKVTHDGEVLGALTLMAGRGHTLLPTDEKLLKQVASGMGLALRNIRLNQDLRRHVGELARSRHRLMTTQDETKRDLEARLRGGAQKLLLALKNEMAVARDDAKADGMDDAVALLDDVIADTDRTVDSLHDFARGVYPQLLETEGPASALASHAHQFPLPVTVHAAGVDRHDRSVEATVYFSVLEALQNVVKHASATSAHVALREDNGTLRLEVSDDGVGFDPATVVAGSGLTNIADRLDALNGEIQVESSPGKGTTVMGRIPLRVGATV